MANTKSVKSIIFFLYKIEYVACQVKDKNWPHLESRGKSKQRIKFLSAENTIK